MKKNGKLGNNIYIFQALLIPTTRSCSATGSFSNETI